MLKKIVRYCVNVRVILFPENNKNGNNFNGTVKKIVM